MATKVTPLTVAAKHAYAAELYAMATLAAQADTVDPAAAVAGVLKMAALYAAAKEEDDR